MLGKRSEQKGLWEADRLYLDYVGKDTFYGLLASLRGQLFSDDDFAEIYCPDNGRDSVPPSLLATALLLQTYDKVSDAEAKRNTGLWPLRALGCVDISPQPDESGSEMKEAKVSGVQLLKPGEDPAVMLYFVDEAFDQMTLPV